MRAAVPAPFWCRLGGVRNEEVAMRDNYWGYARDRWRPNSTSLAFQIRLSHEAETVPSVSRSHLVANRVQCLPAVKVSLLAAGLQS